MSAIREDVNHDTNAAEKGVGEGNINLNRPISPNIRFKGLFVSRLNSVLEDFRESDGEERAIGFLFLMKFAINLPQLHCIYDIVGRAHTGRGMGIALIPAT